MGSSAAWQRYSHFDRAVADRFTAHAKPKKSRAGFPARRRLLPDVPLCFRRVLVHRTSFAAVLLAAVVALGALTFAVPALRHTPVPFLHTVPHLRVTLVMLRPVALARARSGLGGTGLVLSMAMLCLFGEQRRGC
jgi:hypothetical protein